MLDGTAKILKNFEEIFQGTLQESKTKIKELL
jgi:hypothetical protein